jgi:amino-acid N-acetyltransferase
MNMVGYQLVIAEGSLRKDAISLLEQNELPVSDIDDTKILFALTDGHEMIGTGGLEFFHDCALLRSLSVKRDWQGKGLGKSITHQLEHICREKGIKHIYLFTETAEDFFNKQGYKATDRASAPLSIKNSSEFTTVCSTTGVLMHKSIQ